MRRAFALILGLAAIVGVIVASVVWLRDHEDDGRSPYERLLGDEVVSRSAPFACFPRRPGEEKVAVLNESVERDDAIVPGEPERLLLCRYWGMNHGEKSLRMGKRKLVTDPATVRLIADGLNDLPPFPRGAFSCPVDEGARTYAFFAYPDDPTVIVEVRRLPCGDERVVGSRLAARPGRGSDNEPRAAPFRN
jgi:hypothetical protein